MRTRRDCVALPAIAPPPPLPPPPRIPPQELSLADGRMVGFEEVSGWFVGGGLEAGWERAVNGGGLEGAGAVETQEGSNWGSMCLLYHFALTLCVVGVPFLSLESDE